MNTDRPEDKANSPTIPDLPKAITSFGAAVLGDAVYVYGGHHGHAHHYSQSGQSGDLLRLSLTNPTTWEVAATGPKLQGLAMVPHGGKLYRVGGFTARNTDDEEHDLWSVSDFARFDPAIGQWEELPPIPGPRSSFDAAVAGDTLYAVGGWTMHGNKETDWQESAWSVDLSQNTLEWKPMSKPPFVRRALSVGALDGKVYVIGGMQPDGKVTRETVIYDPQTDRWSDGPQLPGDDMEGFGSACYAIQQRLYVSTASGKLLRLSDDGSEWQIVKNLPSARFFHRMLPTDDSRFVILGGANMESGRFSQCELVTPNVESNETKDAPDAN